MFKPHELLSFIMQYISKIKLSYCSYGMYKFIPPHPNITHSYMPQ